VALLLLLSKGKQLQTGADWDSVASLSVVLLMASVVAILVALAVSRSLHRRRRRDGGARRRSGRRPVKNSGPRAAR
jgi:hypothetical protein